MSATRHKSGLKHVNALVILAVLIGVGTAPVANASEGNVDLPRFASISPDGESIVFSWRGDLWKVSADGGTALRLTSHPADERWSAWSPDGERLAFDSTRDGFRNIYVMNADGTNIQQVTDTDRGCELAGWGVDENSEQVITYSMRMEMDVYREQRPFMISPDGGIVRRVHDAFGKQPRVSPDGDRVVFARGAYFYGWRRRHGRGPETQDVWMYDRTVDSFTRLTEWSGNDGRARWGGDRTLIYMSDRELDCVNLYRMSATDGEDTSVRLTSFEENPVQSFDVSQDGSTAVMHVWDTLYTLDLNDPNAQPQPLTINAPADELDPYEIKSVDREVSEAALSPDGKVMAYVAYGEVFVRNIEDESPTQRVTESHAREREIAWSPDGLKLYFSSDRDGTDSIYAATVALTRSEVKAQFEEDEEQDPATDDDEAEAEANGDNGADEDADDGEDKTNEDDTEDSEDAEKQDKQAEEELPKELDPKRWHDAIQFNIEPVVKTRYNDRLPQPSPDGKHLSFRRTRGDLVIRDLETGEDNALVESWDWWIEWRWSPDSRYIAYSVSDMNFNNDIFIAPIDGSAQPVNITQHPDNDVNPRWSADGKILSFVSERKAEAFDVWMVYLDEDLEALTDKERKEYYENAAKQAKKRKPLKPKHEDNEENDDAEQDEENGEGAEEQAEQTEPPDWELESAYLRLRRVTSLPDSETSLLMTPSGNRYIFNAGGGEPGLYSIKWNGEDRKRLTGRVNPQHVTLKGDKIVFVDNSRGGTINVANGKRETINIDAEIRIEYTRQQRQKFNEATRVLGLMFYHPNMKGVDWDALSDKYLELAERTRTPSEFEDVTERLFGELTASHLGVFSAGGYNSPNRAPHGRLGIAYEPVENGFRVTHVVEDSPASKGPMALQVGDVITEIDGEPFEATETVHTRLANRVGKETLITIEREPADDEHGDAEPREYQVLITPTSGGQLRQLAYEDWRRDVADKVEQRTDGRIGYIHIQSMGQQALDVFERDLFAAANNKDGLIIDVRDNGGGWTTDRVLSSIMAEPHAYTIPRGADSANRGHYPQDRLFIWRYTLPINMLCNEKSFSNAEIISHAFKTLDRGTLVGEETWGGVISTGGFGLVDGSFVRLPFRGWYVMDGTNRDMENNGAVPHIRVPKTPQDEAAGRDAQLNAAVEDLLQRLEE